MAERAKKQGDTAALVAVWTITAAGGLQLVVHLFLKILYGNLKDGLDEVAVGLTAVGLSPWIARILESFKFGGIEFNFVKQQVEEQRMEINALKFLIASLVSTFELEHLKKLESNAEFIIDKEYFPEDFQRELRHMRDLGLIENYPIRGIRAMYAEPGRHKNVHDFFRITEAGKTYLKLHAEMAEKALRAPS